MADRELVVGVDLGGTHMQIGVVDPDGKVVSRTRDKTRAEEGFDAVVGRIAKNVREACDGVGRSVDEVAAVGIGTPGAVDYERGIVLEAPNLRWNDAPLANGLSSKLDGARVTVENDVNSATLGEHRLGAGRGADHVLGVWIGTGIGGGLVIGGKLHRGGFATAGEIGHTICYPDAQPGCRRLEHLVSRRGISARLAALIEANHRSVLTELTSGEVDAIGSAEIAEAYGRRDELTVRVVDAACGLIGTTIANACTLLSLERVVLGGGIVERMSDVLVGLISKRVKRDTFPRRAQAVEVVPTELGDNAGLLGAALVARGDADG